MYTTDGFKAEWQRRHRPSMKVDSDVAFHYRLYGELLRIARQHARCLDDAAILTLLLYTENIIAVGLDGVYERMYRSAGDAVSRWCDGLGMGNKATSQVRGIVSEAVADARHSALREWITDSVLSGGFPRLSGMLAYFAREDKILRRIYPDLRHRKAMFLRLTGSRQTARQMLWADLAFNWRDKHGRSLAETLSGQCRLSAHSTGGQESMLLKRAAKALASIRSEQLDAYTVIERKNGDTITLRHRDGRVFTNVTSAVPPSGNAQCRQLAAQLVTYMGKTYANGPAVWLTDKALATWNGGSTWSDILKNEQETAKQTYFTTTFGKRISLYEDLYTMPEDPEEAYYAGMGIYPDEPSIFGFLEIVKSKDLRVKNDIPLTISISANKL